MRNPKWTWPVVMAATGLAASSPWIGAQSFRDIESDTPAIPNAKVASTTDLSPGGPLPPQSKETDSTVRTISSVDAAMLRSRSARTLLRNGLDYIKYQQYEKALTYLREAQRRQKELNANEKVSLGQAIDSAQEGLRTPSRQIGYARSRRPQPGSIAIAGRSSSSDLPERGKRVDAPSDPSTLPASAEMLASEPKIDSVSQNRDHDVEKLAPLSPEILAKELPSAADLARSNSSVSAMNQYEAAGTSISASIPAVAAPRPLNETISNVSESESEFQASEVHAEHNPQSIAETLTARRQVETPPPLPGSPSTERAHEIADQALPTTIETKATEEPIPGSPSTELAHENVDQALPTNVETRAAQVPLVKTPELPPIESPEVQTVQDDAGDSRVLEKNPEASFSQASQDIINNDEVEDSEIRQSMTRSESFDVTPNLSTSLPQEKSVEPKDIETVRVTAKENVTESSSEVRFPESTDLSRSRSSTENEPKIDETRFELAGGDNKPATTASIHSELQDVGIPPTLTPLAEDETATPAQLPELPVRFENSVSSERDKEESLLSLPKLPATNTSETEVALPPLPAAEITPIQDAVSGDLPPLPINPATISVNPESDLPPLPDLSAPGVEQAKNDLPPLPNNGSANVSTSISPLEKSDELSGSLSDSKPTEPAATASLAIDTLPMLPSEEKIDQKSEITDAGVNSDLSDSPPVPTSPGHEVLPKLPEDVEQQAINDRERTGVGSSESPPAPPAEEISEPKGADVRSQSDQGAFSRRFLSGLNDRQRREIEELARLQLERAGGSTPGLSPLDSPARDASDLPRVPMPSRSNPLFGASEDPLVRLELPRAPSPAEARPIRAILLPEQFDTLKPREFDPRRKMWASAATAHYPLYFQDPSLERYGISVEQRLGTAGRKLTYPIDDPKESKLRNQIATPFFSSGLFALQIATWPFRAIADPPWESTYDLGYYRPGDLVPEDTVVIPWKGVGPLFRGNGY